MDMCGKNSRQNFSISLVSILDLYRLKFDELNELKKFKNLSNWEMNTHYAYRLDNDSEIDENIIKFKKLNRIKCCYCCLDYSTHDNEGHDKHFIPKLIKTNPQIKSLIFKNEIEFSKKNIGTELIEMNFLLDLKLKEFGGKFYFKDFVLNDFGVLMKLSKSFNYLQKLDLIIKVQFSLANDNKFTMQKIMQFFENLTDLVELNLTFEGITVLFREINCECFSKCEKLQKLSIQLSRSNDYMNSNFFSKCENNLKSLKCLNIDRIKYDKKLIKTLSLCNNLTTLKIFCLNTEEYLKCLKKFDEDRINTKFKSIEIILKPFSSHLFL